MSKKCAYADKCGAYRDDSHTCNVEPCGYCGIFRELQVEGEE